MGWRNVIAIDNDPIAVAATRENVERNAVDVQVLEGSLGGGSDLPHWLGSDWGRRTGHTSRLVYLFPCNLIRSSS